MRYRTLLLIILSTVIIIALFGLGIGFVTAFISDKFGDNIIRAGLIILTVLSLLYLVRDEIKSKKSLSRKTSQYLALGKLLFKNHTRDFEVFYNAYLQTGNNNRRPIEVLHDFADKKGLSLIVDWRGKENDEEIQHFINSQVEKTISWTSTTKLSDKRADDEIGDGKFIIRLFKAIDKDLKEINKKLLFFVLGNDAYAFAVTDSLHLKRLQKLKTKTFMEVKSLRLEVWIGRTRSNPVHNH